MIVLKEFITVFLWVIVIFAPVYAQNHNQAWSTYEDPILAFCS